MTRYKRDFEFNENIIETIAYNVIKYRKINGITQEQLAADIDISYDHIRRLESTLAKEGISIETLVKISVVLEKKLDDFIY